MKNKFLLLAISFLMALSAHLSAEVIEIDGIQYSTSETVATVIGFTDYLEPVVIPESIAYNGNTYRVISIGDHAFESCTSLTSISIPNSVTSIGSWAFFGCYSLKNIIIPDCATIIGNGAFSNCRSLTHITLPNGVTSIEQATFEGCVSLTSIAIPNSVTSIGQGAFWECTSLTSITIPNSVTSIVNNAFNGCSGLVSIVVQDGNSTYDSRNNSNAIIETGTNTLIAGCKNSVIPESVTSIGRNAFSNCTSLSSITIPNSVTTIGGSAFYNCTGLESINIPNSVTSIGAGAFAECASLTSTTIPNSVTSIGDGAFYDCTGKLIVNCDIGFFSSPYDSYGWFRGSKFSSVEIGEGVTTIGKEAFYMCSNLTNIIISNSVTSIGEEAFYNCTSLTSITIPNSITGIDDNIGNNAFYNCNIKDINVNITNWSSNSILYYYLPKEANWKYYVNNVEQTDVIVPDSVTSIGLSILYNAKNITSITISNSVTSIGHYAFYGCKGLVSITCFADTPPTAYSKTFESVDMSKCTLYVKKNTASLFASAAGWKTFTNIVEIDDQNMDINQIQTDLDTEIAYDLSGNRVQQLQKGRTYIRNGKKILVK